MSLPHLSVAAQIVCRACTTSSQRSPESSLQFDVSSMIQTFPPSPTDLSLSSHVSSSCKSVPIEKAQFSYSVMLPFPLSQQQLIIFGLSIFFADVDQAH